MNLDFKTFLEGKKAWAASKSEILDFWKNLKPGQIVMEPIPANQKGTRMRSDSIRVTGSAQFINSILARITDLINYDNNPGTRLDLEYREIDVKGMPSGKFLCYIHLEQDTGKIRKTLS